MQEANPADQENQEQEDIDMDSGNGPGEAIDEEMPDVNDDTNDISPGKSSSCSDLSSLNVRAYEIFLKSLESQCCRAFIHWGKTKAQLPHFKLLMHPAHTKYSCLMNKLSINQEIQALLFHTAFLIPFVLAFFLKLIVLLQFPRMTRRPKRVKKSQKQVQVELPQMLHKMRELESKIIKTSLTMQKAWTLSRLVSCSLLSQSFVSVSKGLASLWALFNECKYIPFVLPAVYGGLVMSIHCILDNMWYRIERPLVNDRQLLIFLHTIVW